MQHRSLDTAAPHPTILPLFRDMLLGVVVAVTSLVVLSSIGVDIAPLLAGSG